MIRATRMAPVRSSRLIVAPCKAITENDEKLDDLRWISILLQVGLFKCQMMIAQNDRKKHLVEIQGHKLLLMRMLIIQMVDL